MNESRRPSLYETLFGNFTGGLDLHQVSEQNQVILSVLDNMQCILNCRGAGTLTHLPVRVRPILQRFAFEWSGFRNRWMRNWWIPN